MPNDSNGNTVVDYELILLAGFATAPRFMEGLRVALSGRLAGTGARVISAELLFPYGDWSRGKVAQLWEIRSDMRIGADERRVTRSIGGQRAVEAILSMAGENEDRERPGITLLVGHSGGGIAAVHAAQLLLASGVRQACLVAMIGSPKSRIAESMRPNVLSINAAARGGRNASTGGRSADPVAWFGTHGYRDSHAPGTRVSVPLIGGHADYFREAAPYVGPDGKSNLDVTLDAIMTWINQWNRTSFR